MRTVSRSTVTPCLRSLKSARDRLAGFIPSGLEELVPKRPLEGKEFFVAHGTKDETVTIDRARHSVVLLEQAGARVTYCEDEVGHKVSAHCVIALKNFFRD